MQANRQPTLRNLLAIVFGAILLACRPAHAEPARERAASERIVALRIEPAALVLANRRDVRRFVVLGRRAVGDWVDLTDRVRLTPADDRIALAPGPAVRPQRVGQSAVEVRYGALTARLPVRVASMTAPSISFVRDVMPILSRAGCNSGTCHGAGAGKNGFKLSLRGYDPEFDYAALAVDVAGRRVNRTEPRQSLLLLKPTQGVPHMGGLIFEVDSPEYRVIRQWIVEGARSDVGSTARVARLEAFPKRPVVPLPGMKQRQVVIAHYPDGTTRDVTEQVVFSSSAREVASVEPDGTITAARRGETAILMRYEGAYYTNEVTVMGDRRGFRWTPVPEYNFIDTAVYRKLRRFKVAPGELCTDDEFIRRVSLDLTGIPPAPEAVRRFLADPTESRVKRARLVEELLDSPAYVEYWTNKWADLLQVNRKYLGDRGVWVFRQWIREAVARNLPYDEFVRQLLTARGNSNDQPAANYMRILREPAVANENVTQLFLGVRFQCAKCHDHPFEVWTQNQYYQFAAYFAQVEFKRDDGGAEIVYDRTEGEVKHPKGDRVVAPRVPFEHPGAKAEGPTRREALARWLTAPENPLFAKAIVNRVWSYLLGRGIIDPVDDLRNSNPPVNAELLDALTADFVRSGFDLKHLLRTITASRVYQHRIETNRWNEDDRLNFSHALPRRLTAEQLLDAIAMATDSWPKFPGLPRGIRAAQLPDTRVAAGGFLDLFGRPPRESPCECERSNEVSLSQTLNLINGATIAEAINDPEGRVARLAKSTLSDEEVITEIYLAAWCRYPTPREMATSLAHLRSAGSRLEGAQDLMWALINTPAFLFNR